MWLFSNPKKLEMPSAEKALKGRAEKMPVPPKHFVLNAPIDAPFEGLGRAMFGMGCFWGAEKKFWSIPGVVSTAVGYAAGFTENPTYKEVCSGQTGHNEVVRVIFDASKVSYGQLLKTFWENHNPTQGMRQGNDTGTQYRSGVYAFSDEQLKEANASKSLFESELLKAGYERITTEVLTAPTFYFAEDYHQQYLAKNPDGYCGLGGTGVSCPIGIARPANS